MAFEPVDASDQRRLTRTRRTDHDDDLLLADDHVDVRERLEVPEELVHRANLDDRLPGATHDLGRIGIDGSGVGVGHDCKLLE